MPNTHNLVFAPRLMLGSLVALLLFNAPALAGPPLICHPISIGSAQSLPFVGDGWNLSGRENYDSSHLISDTTALLNPNTAVLVRMETLRRATLYAFASDKPALAKELLLRLQARTTANPGDGLAAFDFGYLVESYKEEAWLLAYQNAEAHPPKTTHNAPSNPAAGVDGYAWVTKAIGLRQDPEMEFAAALIVAGMKDGSESARRSHMQKAVAGAKSDPLLEKNLASS